MNKPKRNDSTTKSIIKILDGIAKRRGLNTTRHAVNKWAQAQRDKLRLTKQSAALQKQLEEVNRRLSR